MHLQRMPTEEIWNTTERGEELKTSRFHLDVDMLNQILLPSNEQLDKFINSRVLMDTVVFGLLFFGVMINPTI